MLELVLEQGQAQALLAVVPEGVLVLLAEQEQEPEQVSDWS